MRHVLFGFAAAIALLLSGCSSQSSSPPAAPTPIAVGLLPLPSIPVGIVTTFAGSGTSGDINATGTAASFFYPQAVAVDSSGNVYVADMNNNQIRKISSAGVVTTFASDIPQPAGVAVDTHGNVYVADPDYLRILKITGAGVASSFAGGNHQGYKNGKGSLAEFLGICGIAVDKSGNVYVADAGNNRIRKITPAAVVTTLAGSGVQGYKNGTGTAAQFDDPSAVTVSASGVVYVADTGNYRIRKITPIGVVTTLAGSGVSGSQDGTGTTAQFSPAFGIAVDTLGNVYLADSFNSRIRKITAAGVVTTLAGSWGGFQNGTGTVAQFGEPYDVAVAPNGNLFVADYLNNAIRLIR